MQPGGLLGSKPAPGRPHGWPLGTPGAEIDHLQRQGGQDGARLQTGTCRHSCQAVNRVATDAGSPRLSKGVLVEEVGLKGDQHDQAACGL